jgi:hypothetical protein
VYAIGGSIDGLCERYDMRTNTWKTITRLPPMREAYNLKGLNILDKYIYVLAPESYGALIILKLDIAQ